MYNICNSVTLDSTLDSNTFNILQLSDTLNDILLKNSARFVDRRVDCEYNKLVIKYLLALATPCRHPYLNKQDK